MKKFIKTIILVITKKSIYDFVNIIMSYIYTKICFTDAKIIRLPLFRTKKGKFLYGKNMSIGPGAIIDIISEKGILTIGDRFNAYHRLHIGVLEKVSIGDDVLIASNVYISDSSHGWYKDDIHSDPMSLPNSRPIFAEPIIIGNRVWLGEGVMILSGVTIGDGSIIGAGSIVTKNIPPNSIAAGNPARIIKKYNLELKYWVKV